MSLGKVRRGLAYFAIVTIAFFVGLALHGRLPSVEAGHPLSWLATGTVWGTGLLRAGAQLAGLGAGDIASASYEYGNTYLLTAGLMNLLLVLDTLDIAAGRKT